MTHTRVPARAWRALFARSLPVWQLNLLFWGLFGAMAFGLRLFMGVPLWRALVSTVIFEGMCLLLAFALRGIYRRSRRDFGLSSAFRMIFLSFAAAATVVVTKESGDRIRFNTTKGGRYTLLPR